MKVTMNQYVHRSLLGLEKHVLWHPITYKEKQFIVELTSIATGEGGNSSGKIVMCDIYEYNEEKTAFRGHRGRLMWSGDVSVLRISEKTELHLVQVSVDDFKIHLPLIIKRIFEKYEEGKNEGYKRLKFLEESEELEWNGVVEP